ncbi:MAG: EscU/YscU/HrcU family type III secretion system export apparatus switch protein, partial [Nevskiales bacterium]
MSESAQERTERATPKRRSDARKRGQVARSREIGAAAVVGAAALTAMMAGSRFAASAELQMRQLLSLDASALMHPEAMPGLFGHACMQAMLLCAPVFGACVCAALLAPMLLGGWNFSVQALQPDLSRLNPLSGLGRMFSGHGAVELLKGMVKLAWIGGVAAL